MSRNGWITIGTLLLATLIALTSRNPNVIVSVAVVALIVFFALGGLSARNALNRRSARQAEERERQENYGTPWKHFSRPVLGTDTWQVGVERVTEEGRVLNRVTFIEMDQDDMHARIEAEGTAMTRAQQYNDAKAGM